MSKKTSQPKLISSKKVPKLFRKKYTTKRLEKKIYKKLYIDKDRDFVESFFKKNESGLYTAIFPQKMVKTDFLRLKKLAKQIKKQKRRIKIVPLVAVFVAIAIIMITVILGKNIFVKTILQKKLESAFEAKTTIEQVDVEILNSRIAIQNLTIANKDSPMKNLVQVGKIMLDFDLTQILRGRFVSENIEASDMQIETNRKTSGALATIKKDSNSKTLDEENTIKISNQKGINSLKMQITDLFDNYDPKTIIEESTKQLKTPEVAKKSEQQIKEIVEKWQKEPDRLQKKVTTFNTLANKIINKNYTSIKDPVAIKNAISDINSSLQQAQSLKKEIDTVSNTINADRATVVTMEKTLQNGIRTDKNIVDTKINAIKSVSLGDSKNYIINTILEFVGLETVKKYFPYIKKAINIANSMKKEKAEESIKNAEQNKSRLYGRDVYYKKNTYPTFLIEKIQCSGPEFSAILSDVSNNANLWGKPITGKVTLLKAGLSHTVLTTVDTRTTTNTPLITVNYTGTGYKISIDANDISSNAVGIPSIKGDNSVVINATADTDGSFGGVGLFKLTDLNIFTEVFNPEWGYKIYSNALQNIKAMDVSANFAFNPASGLSLNIKNDADGQIQKTVTNGINSILDDVKITAKKRVVEELNKYTNGYEVQFKDFNDIYTQVKEINIDSTITELNNKKDTLTKQAISAAKAIVEDKVKEAEDKAKAIAEEKAKVLEDSAKAAVEDKAKDLIKGFGF